MIAHTMALFNGFIELQKRVDWIEVGDDASMEFCRIGTLPRVVLLVIEIVGDSCELKSMIAEQDARLDTLAEVNVCCLLFLH